MKKLLSLILALVLAASVLAFSVSAKEIENIVIEFSSDVSGLTYEDYDRIAVIKSDGLVCKNLQINDYVGNVYLEEMKPGRTYTYSYTFTAAEGYALPETVDESNVTFLCDDSCTVWWYGKTVGPRVDGVTQYSFSVSAEVTVDGNLFQRIFGRIADFFRKLLSWSPY